LRNILKSRINIRPSAVAVSINSGGGSVTGAKNIAKLLSRFTIEKEIPYLTFVDDLCLGAANIIFSSGYKTYASRLN
jgi:ClpP class serine protease